MKDRVLQLTAMLMVKSFLLIMDFNEWRAKRNGYICSECGSPIIRGTGVVIHGKRTFFCQDCIRRTYGKWEEDQTSHHSFKSKWV